MNRTYKYRIRIFAKLLGSCLLSLVLCIGLSSCQERGQTDVSPASDVNLNKLRQENFFERMALAVQRNSELEVVYRDHLGEGPDHWDSDPRYPVDVVNCMTWLQLVLSEAYSASEGDRVAVMDALRYYGCLVGFSFRKHYIDRWTELEPGPLKKIDSRPCSLTQSATVDLQLDRFKKKIGYSCPLYRENRRKFSVRYMRGDKLLSCADSLANGYYVVFAIASKKYLEMYGGFSGPMAQVHGMILEVSTSQSDSGLVNIATVHHASTSKGMVMSVGLNEYIRSMSMLHSGYTLFGLDPEWKRSAGKVMDPAFQRLVFCESRAKGKAIRIFQNEELEVKGDR